MSHTPGPWELWTSNSWRRITSRATGSTVCEPVTQRDGHPDLYFRNGGEDGPDARLLVAAPDLLEALQMMVAQKGMVCDCGIAEEVFDKARAAIAKVEGR